MTLAEFLLARLAEDAEHARLYLDPLTTRAGGMIRVRAQCEATRRVVSMLGTWEPDDPDDDSSMLAEAVLRVLSSAYADHPDYRQEWRP